MASTKDDAKKVTTFIDRPATQKLIVERDPKNSRELGFKPAPAPTPQAPTPQNTKPKGSK